MNEEDLLRLQGELESRLQAGVEQPYGGLFGDSVLVEVIEEMVADPLHYYRSKDLEEILERSKPSIRGALRKLTSLGLLENVSSDTRHPLYRVNMESKRLAALTFLAYAVHDDREGTTSMDEAIAHYYKSTLWEIYGPCVITNDYVYLVSASLEYHAPTTEDTSTFDETTKVSGVSSCVA